MKKRVLSLLLTLVMVLSLVPVTGMIASAADDSIYVGGVKMTSGDFLAVGATQTTTEEPDDGYAYYEDGALLLYNYEYEGEGYTYNTEELWSAIIYSANELYIYLEGENTLIQTDEDSDGIFVLGGTIEGTGTLNLYGGFYGAWSDYSDLIVNSGTIISEYSQYGLFSYGNIIINGATVDITSICDAISTMADLTITDSNITAKSIVDAEYDTECRAIYADGALTIGDSLTVKASVDPDGTLGEYVAENNDTYDYIKISAPDVYVGGVGMFDGDYLAVNATETATAKPNGGYAYYKDGALTLNNYEYEGQGYIFDTVGNYGAIVYAKKPTDIILVGENTIIQTDDMSVNIVLDYGGTIKGSGTLNAYGGYFGVSSAYRDLTINNGTVNLKNCEEGIFSYSNVIINGGNVDIEGRYAAIWVYGDVNVNGGNLTAKVTSEDSQMCAIYADGAITINPSLTVKAAADANGALGEYVAENHFYYQSIVIEGADVTFGDVDNDGDVDSVDYLFVKRYCLGTYELDEDALVRADVNGNGSVDSVDYLLVKRIVLGTYSVK